MVFLVLDMNGWWSAPCLLVAAVCAPSFMSYAGPLLVGPLVARLGKLAHNGWHEVMAALSFAVDEVVDLFGSSAGVVDELVLHHPAFSVACAVCFTVLSLSWSNRRVVARRVVEAAAATVMGACWLVLPRVYARLRADHEATERWHRKLADERARLAAEAAVKAAAAAAEVRRREAARATRDSLLSGHAPPPRRSARKQPMHLVPEEADGSCHSLAISGSSSMSLEASLSHGQPHVAMDDPEAQLPTESHHADKGLQPTAAAVPPPQPPGSGTCFGVAAHIEEQRELRREARARAGAAAHVAEEARGYLPRSLNASAGGEDGPEGTAARAPRHSMASRGEPCWHSSATAAHDAHLFQCHEDWLTRMVCGGSGSQSGFTLGADLPSAVGSQGRGHPRASGVGSGPAFVTGTEHTGARLRPSRSDEEADASRVVARGDMPRLPGRFGYQTGAEARREYEEVAEERVATRGMAHAPMQPPPASPTPWLAGGPPDPVRTQRAATHRAKMLRCYADHSTARSPLPQHACTTSSAQPSAQLRSAANAAAGVDTPCEPPSPPASRLLPSPPPDRCSAPPSYARGLTRQSRSTGGSTATSLPRPSPLPGPSTGTGTGAVEHTVEMASIRHLSAPPSSAPSHRGPPSSAASHRSAASTAIARPAVYSGLFIRAPDCFPGLATRCALCGAGCRAPPPVEPPVGPAVAPATAGAASKPAAPIKRGRGRHAPSEPAHSGLNAKSPALAFEWHRGRLVPTRRRPKPSATSAVSAATCSAAATAPAAAAAEGALACDVDPCARCCLVYCCPEHRAIAAEYIDHSQQCGRALPTPNGLAAASAEDAVDALCQFGEAHTGLAESAMARLLFLCGPTPAVTADGTRPLADCGGVTAALLRRGGFEALLRAMACPQNRDASEQRLASEGVQAGGCSLLAWLAPHVSAEQLLAAHARREAAALALVLDAMRAPSASPLVLARGALAVATIASVSDLARSQLIERGAPATLAAALQCRRGHPDLNAELHANVSAAIASLGLHLPSPPPESQTEQA